MIENEQTNKQADASLHILIKRARVLVGGTRVCVSGLTGALVDVVFHQSDDLLELVLQLSASSGRVRVQRAHHLRHTHMELALFELLRE